MYPDEVATDTWELVCIAMDAATFNAVSESIALLMGDTDSIGEGAIDVSIVTALCDALS
jgi:hypothetical protein